MTICSESSARAFWLLCYSHFRWHISLIVTAKSKARLIGSLNNCTGFVHAWWIIYIIMCILGKPEIWHQHPLLEDRWGSDEEQRGKACFAEKYSDRRSVANFHPSPRLLAATNDESIHVLNISFLFSIHHFLFTRSCLHIRVFPMYPGDVQPSPGLHHMWSLSSKHLLWPRCQLLHPL